MNPPLLELQGVRKRYGELLVIPGLDLLVTTGEFVGVIGPNGAGKSSLFGLISGALRCDKGRVLFKGKDVTSFTADRRCREGIGRTFQVPQPFAGMTVFENVLVATTFGAGLAKSPAKSLAREILERCSLSGVGNEPAGRLSLLHRKRLELARAVATRPNLILLDEVAGGLTDRELEELLVLIGSLHRAGVTVLWIEHMVHALVSSAKRLIVLSDGAVLRDGEPAAVMNDLAVRESYLGADFAGEIAHDYH